MENIIHPCEVPGCPIKGTASKMWNLKRLPGKPLVVVCAKHAHLARKEGVKAYHLQSTLEYEAVRAKEREEAASFIRKHSQWKGRRNGLSQYMAKADLTRLRKEVANNEENGKTPAAPAKARAGAGDEARREGLQPDALAA